MDSKVLYTDEIDDLDEAVSELLDQARDFTLRKNSLAIVMAEEETEYRELYSKLSKVWSFPFIGCTTMAMLYDREGYCGTGISIMLLTADDCRFEVGMTGTLNSENYVEEVTSVYKTLSDRLSSRGKLIISYSVLTSGENDVAGDDLVKTLSNISNGIPIFGGLASDGFNFRGNRVYCNSDVAESGQVIALIEGNIRPRCISVNSIENRANFSYEITESRNNRIYKLGNGTFIQALKKENIAVDDKSDVIADYLLSPFVVTVEQPDGQKVEVARVLSVLNHDDGSGLFLGAMPKGSNLGIGIINREDVQISVTKAFDRVNELIDNHEDGYRYKTILCTTCAARFLALASNMKAEGDACVERLPEGISLLGMYAYGEFCPVNGKQSGTEYNMFHNFTFAIMVF